MLCSYITSSVMWCCLLGVRKDVDSKKPTLAVSESPSFSMAVIHNTFQPGPLNLLLKPLHPRSMQQFSFQVNTCTYAAMHISYALHMHILMCSRPHDNASLARCATSARCCAQLLINGWGDLAIRGVRNPMKTSDIHFQKMNRTEPASKFKNRKLSFRRSVLAVWGRFFTLFHSQFILQHDRINSQSIFLHAVSLHF